MSLSPRRPGPVRRAVALVTAAMFAVLPPLQTVSAQDGPRPSVGQGARQQLANVDPSLLSLTGKLAAPHSQAVKKGEAYTIAHDGRY